jgi:hypothetical protein
MISSDFRWQAPASAAELMGSPDAALHGEEGLRRLPAIDNAAYADVGSSNSLPNLHFMIAEDDIAVLEFDATRTTHDGEQYHNQYCMVIRVADGKIAEVREHTDTKYFMISSSRPRRSGLPCDEGLPNSVAGLLDDRIVNPAVDSASARTHHRRMVIDCAGDGRRCGHSQSRRHRAKRRHVSDFGDLCRRDRNADELHCQDRIAGSSCPRTGLLGIPSGVRILRLSGPVVGGADPALLREPDCF